MFVWSIIQTNRTSIGTSFITDQSLRRITGQNTTVEVEQWVKTVIERGRERERRNRETLWQENVVQKTREREKERERENKLLVRIGLKQEW